MFEMTIKYCQESTTYRQTIPKFEKTQFRKVQKATLSNLCRTFLEKLIVGHKEGKNVVVEVATGK